MAVSLRAAPICSAPHAVCTSALRIASSKPSKASLTSNGTARASIVNLRYTPQPDSLLRAAQLTVPMAETAEVAAEATSLPTVLATAKDWGAALYSALDSGSRLALLQTSQDCKLWALEEHATVSILTYGSLSAEELQKRVTRAQQALATRGQQGLNSKLLLRLATPSPAALDAILGLSGAAGRAVAQVDVRQVDCEPSDHHGAVPTAWLRSLPTTLPNLHTIRIQRLCGTLPPPSTLPHLRELKVHLFEEVGQLQVIQHLLRRGPLPSDRNQTHPATVTAEDMCQSIGEYLPQLRALDIGTERRRGPIGGSQGIPWHSLFASVDADASSEAATQAMARLGFGQGRLARGGAAVPPRPAPVSAPRAGSTQQPTSTLTQFTTPEPLTDILLSLLVKNAPELQHLSCGPRSGLSEDTFASQTWGLTETRPLCLGLLVLGTHGVSLERSRTLGSAEVMAMLPRTPHKLRVVPCEGMSVIQMQFKLTKQGLTDSVRARVDTWHFTAPCDATLVLPNPPPPDLHTCIVSALQQLSSLPPKSTIQFRASRPAQPEVMRVHTFEEEISPAVLTAIAAATPTLPHLKVYAPEVPPLTGKALLSYKKVKAPDACGLVLSSLSGLTDTVDWPWRYLRVRSVSLPDILSLPDPTTGQYEIEAESLEVPVAKWSTDMLSEVERRLGQITFVVRDKMHVYVATRSKTPDSQDTEMRQALDKLQGLRVHREYEKAEVQFRLSGWILTHSVVTELGALPVFDFPVSLAFHTQWLSDHTYVQLPRMVPSCYSTWVFQGWQMQLKGFYTVSTLLDVCAGAPQRGDARERLKLCVHHGRRSGMYSTSGPKTWFTDAERSQVEAFIEARGLGRWLREIEYHWRIE